MKVTSKYIYILHMSTIICNLNVMIWKNDNRSFILLATIYIIYERQDNFKNRRQSTHDFVYEIREVFYRKFSSNSSQLRIFSRWTSAIEVSVHFKSWTKSVFVLSCYAMKLVPVTPIRPTVSSGIVRTNNIISNVKNACNELYCIYYLGSLAVFEWYADMTEV